MVNSLHTYVLESLIFTADWCDPCFDFVPSMNRILRGSGALDRVYTVYEDKDPELCSYYSIKGFPCVVFRLRQRGITDRTFEIPRSRIVGVCDHDHVRRTIDSVVEYKHACNKRLSLSL